MDMLLAPSRRIGWPRAVLAHDILRLCGACGAVLCACVAAVAASGRAEAAPAMARDAAALAAAAAPGAASGATTGSAELADWQREVVYQIYPKSFADADGDGVGDLRGVMSRLDYLRDLGVNVVWLTPVYPSTHFDSGYDVSDYLGIDPMFGTLDDWNALRDALHARGMKIMMDFVLNHSSDMHPWYVQEKRLKVLQHTLTQLVRSVPPAEGEQIVTLVSDGAAPNPDAPPPTKGLQAAARALDAFARDDGAAAVAAGYPSLGEQRATLARALAPCAASPRICPPLEQPLDDFYHWRERPNNWIGLFSLPAWHRVPDTGGYSLSLFSEHQIDLNWRNPRLRAAMGHVITTWEARGADGMRLDSIGTIAKDPTFPDAPPPAPAVPSRGMQFFTNLPDVHRYLRDLGHLYGPDFLSIGEVTFNRPNAPILYSGSRRGECREVFVFDHIGADCDGSKWRKRKFDSHLFKRAIADQQLMVHGKAWLGNYVENHDWMRVVSRFADDGKLRKQSAKLYASLLLTLEGTPYIFQGQEIGMTNLPESTFRKVDDIEDIEARHFYHAQVAAGASPQVVFHQVATRCRDHVRSAMQWDDGPSAGFTHGHAQVPVNANYPHLNVKESEADPDSILRYYQRLIALRRQHASWVVGQFADLTPAHPALFAYTRTLGDEQTLVLLNLAGTQQNARLGLAAPPAAVQLRIGNYDGALPDAAVEVSLRPYEARIYVGRPAAP